MGHAVVLLETDGVPTPEAHEPVLSVAEGDGERVLLGVGVPLGEAGEVPVLEGVSVAVGVPVAVGLVVKLEERDGEGVALADAPVDSEEVGGAVGVVDGVAVALGVARGVPVPLGVGELEGVAVGLCDAVAELLQEGLPVLEGEAPAVREEVGEDWAVLPPLTEELGVCSAVPVADGVGAPVGEPVPVCVDDAEPLVEALPL